MNIIKKFESFKSIDNYNYEWVETDTAWEYREFDRSENKERIHFLMNKLKDGFNEPLIMQYSHKYKTAYITEGNHRLLAAKKLGLKFVPIKVTIDGIEKKEAKKVIGYNAPINENIDPKLPSEIGIDNVYDKEFKPIKHNLEKFEDESLIDFSKLDDINYSEDKIEWKATEEEISKIFNIEDWEHLENIKTNNNYLYFDYMDKLSLFIDINTKDNYIPFFTDEMMKYIKPLIDNNNNTEIDSFFYVEFKETKYYKKYLKEIANVLWDKIYDKDILVAKFLNIESQYGGTVEWLNMKPFKFTDNFTVDGLIFIDEDVEHYEINGFEKTFKEILYKNYSYRSKLVIDFENINDYEETISPKELNINNIFN